MKKFLFTLAIVAACGCAAPAGAEDIKFFSDPVYQSLDPDAPSPMADMINLAEKEGDPRAQYILGDLYSKGKGGIGKDAKKAAQWFETSARNGYYESFIRLAAMAKRRHAPAEAYKWYVLAVDFMGRHAGYAAWRRHAVQARDALLHDAQLTPQDIGAAKRDAAEWKADARREERGSRRQEALEKKEAAQKEKERKSAEREATQKEEKDHAKN